LGYSCTVKASLVLKAILKAITIPGGSSNTWYKGDVEFMFEQGRENSDGAITGQVSRIVEEHCHKAGSARIEPDGHVTRFPGVSREIQRLAEIEGLQEYQTRFQNVPSAIIIGTNV
jgi:hypothetical protein